MFMSHDRLTVTTQSKMAHLAPGHAFVRPGAKATTATLGLLDSTVHSGSLYLSVKPKFSTRF